MFIWLFAFYYLNVLFFTFICIIWILFYILYCVGGRLLYISSSENNETYLFLLLYIVTCILFIMY